MHDNTFASRDLLKSAVMGGPGAATIKPARAAQMQKPLATTVGGKGHAHLTPDEAAFVHTLVVHMEHVT